MHSFCWPWLLALWVVCLSVYLLAQSHPLGLSSLHHDLQILTPSTLLRAACSPCCCAGLAALPGAASLPGCSFAFFLCFVFRSTLQMLISLLSTSAR